MATNTPLRATDVKYVNKDFESLKRDLMKYAQAHFSGSYRDYNEVSPGMMILELQAYIGDVLSYYMDQQFNETKKDTARQIENVEAFAKMRGYKPKGARAARVFVQWIVEAPAVFLSSSNVFVPDPNYLPKLQAGSQATSESGAIFETLETLDFAISAQNPANYKAIEEKRDPSSGNPTAFAVRGEVECIGARTVTEVIDLSNTDFTPYLKTPLAQSDVVEILSVQDEQGNRWYEVDWLAQDVVFDDMANTSDDNSSVPYVLRFKAAPRRFVVDTSLSTGVTSLQFGNGKGNEYNDQLIPNVAQMSLPLMGRKTFTNFAIDPQNFLKTSTLGLSPYATRLLVKYRVGGGDSTNVDAFTINKPTLTLFDDVQLGSVVQQKLNDVRASIECMNALPSEGGGPAESISEIKANSDSYFAAQQRAVTKDDYLTHIMSLPPKFGRVEKAYITPSEFNPFAVDVHVLTLDSNGHLSKPTQTLKDNIKTYFNKLRMVTEGINILPASIINIGVNFGIVVSPQYNRSEVLTNCLSTIKDYLQIDNIQIGQPIVISDMKALLQNILGVISVYKLDIVSFSGQDNIHVSDVSFDVSANTKHGIVYAPTDCIFELRYPDKDIIGETK